MFPTGLTVMQLQLVYQFMTESQCNITALPVPLNPSNKDAIDYKNFPVTYQRGRCKTIVTCPSSANNCKTDCESLKLRRVSPIACLIHEFEDCKLGIYKKMDFSGPAGHTAAIIDTFVKPATAVYLPMDEDQLNLNSGRHCSVNKINANINKMDSRVTKNCWCGNTSVFGDVSNNDHNGEIDMVKNVYPMAVGLFTKMPGRTPYFFLCNGVIIDETNVLTASACLTKFYKPMYVATGKFPTLEDPLHPKSYFVDVMTASLYDIASYKIHNQFLKGEHIHNYDIGMISVRHEFKFNLNVRPVCLPFKYADYDLTNKELNYIGYTPSQLRDTRYIYQLPMTVVANNVCLRINNISRVFTLQNQHCVMIRSKISKEYAGGGIYYKDPSSGLLYLVGISSGLGTPDEFQNPGYRINVAKMIEWIDLAAERPRFCQR